MGTRGIARPLGAALVVLLVVLAALTTGQGAEAKPRRAPIDFPDTDAVLGTCLQLVPHTIALTTEKRDLDVKVVLDGASRADGVSAVTAMRRAYSPLGIMVAATYRSAELTGRDAAGLIAQAKQLFGGRRPAGSDVVYVMTDKDILSATGGSLAGLADCIGGVRYPARAFAVGELGSTSAPGVTNGGGKTMAHEIGHLLGAHHHYTSPEGLLDGDVTTPLSIMGPTIDLIALRFSQVEALMVRGHAQKYLD